MAKKLVNSGTSDQGFGLPPIVYKCECCSLGTSQQTIQYWSSVLYFLH